MIPLSVVVPTHGRTELFLQTLASLERQTLDGFELIVTDDSPTREARRLIQDATMAYCGRTGRPTRYLYSEPRLGQARNTNQGLMRADGELVRILHSDDLLAPRALEAEVTLMNDPRLRLDMLYHLVEAFSETPLFDRQPELTLVQPSLLFRSVMHSGTPLPSATVFRRELLHTVGGMREDFDFLCDWEFCARLVFEQQRRQRFIGKLSPGFVAWRVHPESTTGRLWDRHFVEHEQFMNELRSTPDLAEAMIGDQGTRDGFFATAVRYRYRRLIKDVARMTPIQALSAVRRIARCAASPASLRERLTPAPWTRRGSRRYPNLVVPCEVGRRTADSRTNAATFVEPRKGLRFAIAASLSFAIIKAAKSYAAHSRVDADVAVRAVPEGPGGPGLVVPGDSVEIRPWMDGLPGEPGQVVVMTEFNNSTNLWALRDLLAGTTSLKLTGLNSNAFVEPVLHQCLKLTRPGVAVEATIFDNQHLTSFGFKALLDRLFPGQFTWVGQQSSGPAQHVLRYRRDGHVHATYAEPHTGWTFGMLTTGRRLEHVTRFIDSIEQHCREPYEILLVSPVSLGDLERRPHVRVLRFAERDELGWITRKKNLICEQAAYSDILICHDRFSLGEDFTAATANWGYAYGLAAMRVKLPDGRRGLDWAVVSSQNHVWSEGGLLDYRAYSQYAYNPGGSTMIRKAFWRDFPWNENLFWNEHEDVELCRRVQRAGGVIGLSAATLVAAEDRWVQVNPRIPYCDQNEVLYGRPVGEQRILFLPKEQAA